MSEMSTAEILHLLETGAVEVEGLLPWSSNYTFLARVCPGGATESPLTEIQAVYKPRRGERPLWDFAQGTLCQRERAAFLLSEALGWNVVPPTILRDGPHGPGALQFFIEHDPERHYFTFENEPAHKLQLQQIVLLDSIINNADRKSGHVLLEESEGSWPPSRLWAIDHGVCFHTDHKLRTVIWEFAGAPIPLVLLADLMNLKEQLSSDALAKSLKNLLTKAEISALQRRLGQIIDKRHFLEPGPGRHYPWPPV